MATSSITKNFVISGKEQVEMFIAALEASEKDLAKEKKEKKKKVEYHMVEDEEEFIELMKKWEEAHAGEDNV